MDRPFRLAVRSLVAILVFGLLSTDATAERAVRRRIIEPERFSAAYGYPGAKNDPWPLPGRKPYWGQALGATYYNWGFFGARNHAQYISHGGYYGEYYQFGYSRGY